MLRWNLLCYKIVSTQILITIVSYLHILIAGWQSFDQPAVVTRLSCCSRKLERILSRERNTLSKLLDADSQSARTSFQRALAHCCACGKNPWTRSESYHLFGSWRKLIVATVFFQFVQQLGIVPLTGTCNEEHMKQDLETLSLSPLSDADMSTIDGLLIWAEYEFRSAWIFFTGVATLIK